MIWILLVALLTDQNAQITGSIWAYFLQGFRAEVFWDYNFVSDKLALRNTSRKLASRTLAPARIRICFMKPFFSNFGCKLKLWVVKLSQDPGSLQRQKILYVCVWVEWPTELFGRTSTLRFGPNDRTLFCRTQNLFCRITFNANGILTYFCFAKWPSCTLSLGQIAKRMPTEPKFE